MTNSPFRCVRTTRGGVQVDLLIQTEGVAWIVEIKRKTELGLDVARELAQKVARLPLREGVSVWTALVCDGRLSQALLVSDDIDRLISAKDLLCLRSCAS